MAESNLSHHPSIINDGWISVNERLPDRDDLNEYLVTDGKHYFIARYRHDVKEWDERRTGRIGEYINDKWVRTQITHWHTLPKNTQGGIIMEKIRPRTTLLITDQKLFNCSSFVINNYMNRIRDNIIKSGVTNICNTMVIPYPITDDDIHELMFMLNYTDNVEMVYPDITIDITPFETMITRLIFKHPDFRSRFKMISCFEPLDPSDLEDSPDHKSKDEIKIIKDAINEKSTTSPAQYNDCKEIITLIGSRKFYDIFMELYTELSRKGHIVFIPAIFTVPDTDKLTADEISNYEELHNAKIALSSKVIVVNKDGYIGEDTLREIEFARGLNIPIEFYEEDTQQDEPDGNNYNPLDEFISDLETCEGADLVQSSANLIEASYKYMRPWAEKFNNLPCYNDILSKIADNATLDFISQKPFAELNPLELMLLVRKRVLKHHNKYRIKDFRRTKDNEEN